MYASRGSCHDSDATCPNLDYSLSNHLPLGHIHVSHLSLQLPSLVELLLTCSQFFSSFSDRLWLESFVWADNNILGDGGGGIARHTSGRYIRSSI